MTTVVCVPYMRPWRKVCMMLSRVQLFVMLRTVAHQAPMSMDIPGKNTGVGCHFLLQGIFQSQGSNSCLLLLLHWQANSLPLSHPGNPLEGITAFNLSVITISGGSRWWTGRPGVLRFMESQRAGHDWATELLLSHQCFEGIKGVKEARMKLGL